MHLLRDLAISTAHGSVLHSIALVWSSSILVSSEVSARYTHLLLWIAHWYTLVGNTEHHVGCSCVALLRPLLHHHWSHPTGTGIASVLLGVHMVCVRRVHLHLRVELLGDSHVRAIGGLLNHHRSTHLSRLGMHHSRCAGERSHLHGHLSWSSKEWLLLI